MQPKPQPRGIEGTVCTEYATIIKQFTGTREFLDFIHSLNKQGYNVVSYRYRLLGV